VGPLLDPLGAIVKHNFVILDAMHEENECETCLRGVEFRFLCAFLSHIAATGVEIGERRNMPYQQVVEGILWVAAYALAHPRFGTGPTPSLMLMSRLAGICLKVSCTPLGQ